MNFTPEEKVILRTFFNQEKERIAALLQRAGRNRDSLTFPQFYRVTIDYSKDIGTPGYSDIFQTAKFSDPANKPFLDPYFNTIRALILPVAAPPRIAFNPPQIRTNGSVLADSSAYSKGEIQQSAALTQADAAKAANPGGIKNSPVHPSFTVGVPLKHRTIHSDSQGKVDQRDGLLKLTLFYEEVTFPPHPGTYYYFVAAGTHIDNNSYTVTHIVNSVTANGFTIGSRLDF